MTYYLTFSASMMHGNGYVRIEALEYDTARQAVIEHFGTKWSILYHGDDFKHDSFPDGEWFAFHTDEHLNFTRLRSR